MSEPNDTAPEKASHFIHQAIDADIAAGKTSQVITRFPPEPNAYLHIGHAKAITINYTTAQKYRGRFHLRLDDTNPVKEEQEYIDAIKADHAWLGADWGDHLYHASDYFQLLYEWALALIDAGLAYVDDQTADQIRQTRGTLTEPGVESPHRRRSPEENRDLFTRMSGGEFPDGARVLRAKIDMASANLNLRDPVMYRILHADHPQTGDTWCIYPMYDWAHGQSDWIEGITHSLCSQEFEDHRPLYEWFVDRLWDLGVRPNGVAYKPRQIEFARGNITYMVTSKRRLLQLIETGHVNGWDDPRMPTLVGLRRRGYPPRAIIDFWEGVGVAKRENNIEFSRLEYHVRDHLNRTAQRRMAVLDPIKLIITNYPQGQEEMLPAVNNPENQADGAREVPFCGELHIERNDFMVDAPKKYFRLTIGKEVRLRYAYFVTATDYKTDAEGNITEVHCTYDPATRGGDSPDGRKVKGTIHWVSARHAVDAEVRLYDHLFTAENPLTPPQGSDNWLDNVNADSLTVVPHAKIEPAAADFAPGAPVQFERTGYFTADPDTTAALPVFNRSVTLKDTWGKMQKR